jgi:branched-chain amino acid aminotransferase
MHATGTSIDTVGSVYLNGAIIPTADARVSVLDRGFLWGDGVYEVTPCFQGRPFRLDQHLERLLSSMRFVDLSLEVSRDELFTTTLEVVELNREVTSSHPVCRVGHWVTRGTEEWVPLDRRTGGATLCILVQPVRRIPSPEDYRAGVRLSVVPTRRSPATVLDPRVKTTSRMSAIVGELEGSARGTLALMLDIDGHVAEGPTFNFFLVREGRLITPRTENVLPGITRRAVLDLAAELGIPEEEADLSPHELATAEEFFVTASTWGVLPVASIDRFVPRADVPGAITLRLIDELARLTGNHPLAGRP